MAHRLISDEFPGQARSTRQMGAHASETIRFAVTGPIAGIDLPGLCGRVRAMLAEARPEVALCDVRGVEADAVMVDAVARLQLAAGRHGCRVLRGASTKLLELVSFMGLMDVLSDRSYPGKRPTRR